MSGPSPSTPATRPLDATVAVAGAGIGGLALGAALRRVGIDAVILERKEALGEIGAGITLWPNALAVLDAIGLGGEVRDAGGSVAGGSVRNPDGRWLRRLPDTAVAESLGGLPVCLPRPSLVRILADAVDPSCLRLGQEVTGFAEHGDRVDVHLADGSRLAVSALVAADGIHSAITRQLNPSVRLEYTGYTNWRALCPYPLDERDAGQTWGAQSHFGCLPLGENGTYWFATSVEPRGSRQPGGELAVVRDRLRGWHDPIPAIIDATDESAVLRHDILDRKGVRRWRSTRVVLLGDAAHPMRPHLSHGGGQAIEDAVFLADFLAARGVVDGIAAYDAARRRRVGGVVRESAAVGRAIHVRNAVARRVRDRLIERTPNRVVLRRLRSHGSRSIEEELVWLR